ncbi:MAG: hypothetical protein IV089_05655 [Thiobacillus sp.]|nr:hypothetical protein [Thiobacillus sp.]
MNEQITMPRLFHLIAKEVGGVRDQSLQRYGRLWDAYITIGDLLSLLISQGAEDPISVSESASQRISLTVNLLQSTTVVEQTISSGFYWAASALLRQHMEALARIMHIRDGKSAIDPRPPKVQVLPFNLASNYGRLSELAHVSSGELLSDFALSSSGEEIATYAPTYREQWSRNFLHIHIAHMIVLSIEINLMHQELYPMRALIDPNDRLQEVVSIFIEEGFWKN